MVKNQIVMINGPTSSYTRAVERFLNDIFLQNDAPYDVEFPRMKYLYTMEEIINHVTKSRDDYFDLDDVSLGNLTLQKPENSTVIPIIINYLNNEKNDEKDLIEQYNMTKDDLWIFNETNPRSNIKKELIRMKSFLINYRVRTYEPYNFGDYFECFDWRIEQIFSFEKRYHFSVSLNIINSNCEDYSDSNRFIKGSYWVPSLIVFFALINFILTLRSISINYKYYINFKYRYSKSFIEIERENKPPKKKTKWEMLRPKDKRNIMSKLNYVQAFGCLIQLFGGILTLYEGKDVIIITKYTVGLALLKSIPNLILYFVGSLPIFISFVVFAVANFPYSERFYNFTRVILSLFGMMNGDSILDIIQDITQNSYFLGQLYIYSFNILFICVVINIFVSIIEEAFVNSKIKNQNHWIYSFVKKEQNRVTRGEMKMYEEMRRKNIIRDVLNEDKKKIEIQNENNSEILSDKINIRKSKKRETVKDVDIFSNMIQEAKKEIRNVTKEIEECKESKMKYELNQYLIKRISKLGKLILDVQNSLQ